MITDVTGVQAPTFCFTNPDCASRFVGIKFNDGSLQEIDFCLAQRQTLLRIKNDQSLVCTSVQVAATNFSACCSDITLSATSNVIDKAYIYLQKGNIKLHARRTSAYGDCVSIDSGTVLSLYGANNVDITGGNVVNINSRYVGANGHTIFDLPKANSACSFLPHGDVLGVTLPMTMKTPPDCLLYNEDLLNNSKYDHMVINVELLRNIIDYYKIGSGGGGVVTPENMEYLLELQEAYEKSVTAGFQGTMLDWLTYSTSGLTEDQLNSIISLLAREVPLFPEYDWSSITTTESLTGIKVDNPSAHLPATIDEIVFKNVQNAKTGSVTPQVLLVHFSVQGQEIVTEDIVVSEAIDGLWQVGDDLHFKFTNSVKIKPEYTRMMVYFTWKTTADSNPTAVPTQIIAANSPSVLYAADASSLTWFGTRISGNTPWQGIQKDKPRNIAFVTTNQGADLSGIYASINTLNTTTAALQAKANALELQDTRMQDNFNLLSNNMSILASNWMWALAHHSGNKNDDIPFNVDFDTDLVHVTKNQLAIIETITGTTNTVESGNNKLVTSAAVYSALQNRVVVVESESQLPPANQQLPGVFYCVPE